MTLEARKIDMAQWILGVQDQEIINRLAEAIVGLRQQSSTNSTIPLKSYSQVKNSTFDLVQLKATQQYTPFADGELNALIQEADIQEPIDVLLASID